MASNVKTDPIVTERRKRGEIRGFGRFKVELAVILTTKIILDLATLFGYPIALVDELNISMTDVVGLTMVAYMEQRGQISSTDISPLYNALVYCKLIGIAKSVQRSFDENIGFKGNTKVFLDNIKNGYERLINAVRPIPFQRRWRQVNDVYIESRLEKMDEKKSDGYSELWQRLASHHDIINDAAKRIILEGEPGYGKSTLCLLLAYEWSTSQANSPLRHYDALILLRLRDVRDNSIYKAIKQFLLPRDCQLTEDDVQEILTSGNIKVCFLFDGYDEFRLINIDCDIFNIITSSMFPLMKAITTTRPGCTPDLLGPNVARMRLAGFDENMQKSYIQKALIPAGQNSTVISLVSLFKNNPLLVDLCENPLFFVMFVHLFHDKPELQTVRSVTGFIRCIITCFFSHELNRLQRSPSLLNLEEDPRLKLKLAGAAFEGLKVQNKTLIWNANDLSKMVGQDCYEQYKSVGILIEEESLSDIKDFLMSAVGGPANKITARFFHKTIQEYYAAYYMVHLMKSGRRSFVQNSLKEFDPDEIQYFYVFACGVDQDTANVVINDLLSYDVLPIENWKYNFALTTCILDVTDTTPAFQKAANALAKRTVLISPSLSKFQQGANMHFLQAASTLNIPIKCVVLQDYFGSVNQCEGKLILQSGMCLPKMSTLKTLSIEERGREMTEQEVYDIMGYVSSTCTALKQLWFTRCLLPTSVAIIPAITNFSRDIDVLWRPCHNSVSTLRFFLDVDTGQWKEVTWDPYHTTYRKDQTKLALTEEEHNKLIPEWRQYWRNMKWQKERAAAT